ncbi:uncharacterized protein LOC124531777 [Vanessa cardui]|uniref:uncharacterized protein LOC124531777 n=1 Tax=Vanessa cardui TaxID=171605 RepID=UPI001F132D59|nr:uncharacterized protein LOC124531777 [Vanessa cardui]
MHLWKLLRFSAASPSSLKRPTVSVTINDYKADALIDTGCSFGGNQGPLKVCNIIEASVPPATLFSNLSPNIRPIAIKSKRYSEDDLQFINNEISKLLVEGVIEPSVSPWRAQVLVTGGGIHRKRLVIDYSLTINRFTELDAFPLPSIESIIEKVAKFNYFSQIDLKSAYHQVPILSSERQYTAFETCGKLYQFTRIPFGVTNGVAVFQRTLQYIIDTEKLAGTFAYLDDVTVCGKSKDDHDRKLNEFMNAVKKYKLTLNESKCVFGSDSINLLGYSIHNNTIKPDNDRLKPLLDLPTPTDLPTLKRTLGLFAHYSNRFPFAYPCKDMTATTVIKCLKDLFFMFGTPLYVHSDRGATFMSEQLDQFFYSLGIACSRTTPYNPQGNGQVEKLNGTLWKNIQLYLRSKDMEISDWEKALPVALHSIRSLLCTSTNVTPHERMFNHGRRTSNGESFPSWMLNLGPVLMKRNVRATKYDPIVEEVELLQPNPQYSHVRLSDGRETTISNRQLAPLPENLEDCNENNEMQNSENIQDENPIPNQESIEYNQPHELPSTSSSFKERRSTRERRMPNYLNDYVLS